jgi:putative hemolysin
MMGADPWLSGSLIAALALLFMMAVLSRLETAVISARRSRLPQLCSAARLAEVEAVLESPDEFQSSAHLAKSLCESILYAAAALVGLQLCVRSTHHALTGDLNNLLAVAWPGIGLGAVVAYLAVTVLGESLPKSLATRDPERILIRWLRFIRVFTVAFTPVRWITQSVAKAMAISTGGGPILSARAAHSEEEIKLLVEGSAEEGVLEEDEKEMIHSIFEFTDTVARQVMVPRTNIVSAPVESTLEEAARRAMESGHSRIPVYEGTLDSVVGVVHVKDLLPRLLAGLQQAPIRELLREPIFVPEGKKIDELLQEFRTHKSQMAIVVDEFGGTSGLVTVEDVLEEIVGEIEDEYDVEEHPAAEVSETGGGTLVDGRMTIPDLNDELDLALPEEDNDTVGGFVFSLFGRPPEVGESVEAEGLVFLVEALDGLRVAKVRIIRPDAEADTEAAPA